jgi:hypothetical protein
MALIRSITIYTAFPRGIVSPDREPIIDSMSKKEIGVAAGIRIILREDGFVDCRGATPEHALRAAELRLKLGDRPKDELELMRNWIELMNSKIQTNEFNERVDRAARPRLETARKQLPEYAYPEVAELIVEQERLKRKAP